MVDLQIKPLKVFTFLRLDVCSWCNELFAANKNTHNSSLCMTQYMYVHYIFVCCLCTIQL